MQLGVKELCSNSSSGGKQRKKETICDVFIFFSLLPVLGSIVFQAYTAQQMW